MLPACSKFWEIARAKGSASQDKKQAIIQALVVASRPRTNEAGVIIRAMLVSGRCRIASECFSRQAVGSLSAPRHHHASHAGERQFAWLGTTCVCLCRETVASCCPAGCPAHWVADPAAPGVTCRWCMQNV